MNASRLARPPRYLQTAADLPAPARDPEVARLLHKQRDDPPPKLDDTWRVGWLAHSLLGHRIITPLGEF